MSLINICQVCGSEEGLDGLLLRMIDDDNVRRLIADVVTKSLPIGGLVVRYLRLHKPAKQKLRMSIVGKLLGELVPDVQRAAIERNGRMWTVSEGQWQAAFQVVFDQADKGTLQLPLQGNGYLYGVLMRMADRVEGQQEQQTETERRQGAPQAAVTVQRGAMSIGDALAPLGGGKDPALLRIAQQAKRATPMPEHLRQRKQELRGGAPEPKPPEA